MPKKEVADVATMKRAPTRISREIIKRNKGVQNIVLVGVKTRGIYIAQRLVKRLRQLKDIGVSVGGLNITLYHDDVEDMGEPELHFSDVLAPIEGKEVILVNGILYADRAICAAVDVVMDLGCPKKISLAVLVDRGRRELPIRADYVGKNILTLKIEEIIMEMEERDGADRIMISKGNE